MTYISMHMCTNNPENFKGFIENLESTAKNPQDIEVLVKVDEGDDETIKGIQKVKKNTKVQIQEIIRPGRGYFKLWDDLNYICHFRSREATYICNPNDEIRYATKHWDEILKSYENVFDDGIFRLRISQFRYRNYNDIWEPGFAPDSYAFYSKKWFDIVNDWNPCHGPDAFQQYIAYYLCRLNIPCREQFMRDVVVPHINVSNQGIYEGLDQHAYQKRVEGGWRAWDILLSPKMQQEAKRRAALIRCHIEKERMFQPGKSLVEDNTKKKTIEVRDKVGKVVLTQPYGVSTLGLTLLKYKRYPYQGYYCGSLDGKKPGFFGGILRTYVQRNCMRIYRLTHKIKVTLINIENFFANYTSGKISLRTIRNAFFANYTSGKISLRTIRNAFKKIYFTLLIFSRIPYKDLRHFYEFKLKKGDYANTEKEEVEKKIRVNSK